jgi:hypothetical protein
LTDEIVREEKEEKEGKVVWRMWVRVYAPNGRASIGVASAASDEKRFAHHDHDVYALCHTRSKNRAISDILGLGEVSAEEMAPTEAVAGENSEKTSAEWRVSTGKEPVNGIQQYPITSKVGKTWGICNVDQEHSEASCIPDVKIKADAPPVRTFLVGKFLDGQKAKHHIEYTLKIDEGFLAAVLVRPIVDANSLGELLSACAWTFEKASETTK